MYHTTQPGGHYGALIGNIGGMGDIASGFNNNLSYPYIPGRDVQGVPNANDPIMREKLRQRLLKNPGEGPGLPGFVKKAEAPSQGMPPMGNASFFYGPQYGQDVQQLPIGFGGISIS